MGSPIFIKTNKHHPVCTVYLVDETLPLRDFKPEQAWHEKDRDKVISKLENNANVYKHSIDIQIENWLAQKDSDPTCSFPTDTIEDKLSNCPIVNKDFNALKNDVKTKIENWYVAKKPDALD